MDAIFFFFFLVPFREILCIFVVETKEEYVTFVVVVYKNHTHTHRFFVRHAKHLRTHTHTHTHTHTKRKKTQTRHLGSIHSTLSLSYLPLSHIKNGIHKTETLLPLSRYLYKKKKHLTMTHRCASDTTTRTITQHSHTHTHIYIYSHTLTH